MLAQKYWLSFHISPYPSVYFSFTRSEPLGTMQIFTASIKNQFPYRFENNAIERWKMKKGWRTSGSDVKEIKYFFQFYRKHENHNFL